MTRSHYHILFLCTGNSARSILAEAILNRFGGEYFRGFSAGSFPKGEVHPCALELLQQENYPISQLRSKSWHEFTAPNAPEIDFIITVCDNAASEACPIWPGKPTSAHWGLPDPAAVNTSVSAQHLAFAKTLQILQQRIESLVTVAKQTNDKSILQEHLKILGETAITEPTS